MPSSKFWKNRRVLITGNSGIKGTWITVWLKMLGADVYGFSLPPPTEPNMFDLIFDRKSREFYDGDIKNLTLLNQVFNEIKPEIVIHMAAQSLVRVSYAEPVSTFATNVLGTVNVLEASRNTHSVSCLVCVTSDKCYELSDVKKALSENNALGGYDPYSSSKACAELTIGAYQKSFFNDNQFPLVASVRAGNVIGGGDWALDRLIPDIVRGFLSNDIPTIRNPSATRPWQHILDCLYGYIVLTEKLASKGSQFVGPWNFGPAPNESRSVKQVADEFAKAWGGGVSWVEKTEKSLYEESSIILDCSKANLYLGWHPLLSFERAIEFTANWYKSFSQGDDMLQITKNQIDSYQLELAFKL